jgi:UDP-glucose 4-epimerase
VEESIRNPLKYYANNVGGLIDFATTLGTNSGLGSSPSGLDLILLKKASKSSNIPEIMGVELQM